MAKYKCEIHELYKKENKTFREKEFLVNYEFGCPVNLTPCLCNKIAWMVEDHFRTMERYKVEQFDKEKLKNPNVGYSTQMYNRVKLIKQQYDEVVHGMTKQHYSLENTDEDMDVKLYKETVTEEFKKDCMAICGEEDVVCNIVIDLCYNTGRSKQFAWELYGDIIIRNLLAKNNNKLSFPKQSDEEEFTYKGLTFKMEVVEVETDSE
jgi:hypothetical protein